MTDKTLFERILENEISKPVLGEEEIGLCVYKPQQAYKKCLNCSGYQCAYEKSRYKAFKENTFILLGITKETKVRIKARKGCVLIEEIK